MFSLSARRAPQQQLLGLFPWFGPELLGGAELSGRLAWEAVVKTRPAHLFTYGAPPGAVGSSPERTAVKLSKPQALRAALGCSVQPQLVLIWHLGMLKLLPFFRARRARVALMLLGIEAWRRHDPLTRLLLRRVDLFLSISDHTWRRFLHVYPGLAARPQRTVALGLGEPATAVAPPAAPPAALVVSRLVCSEDYKGHRELIAAWPLVRKRVPNAELWIAGDGDLRPVLEQLVAAQGLGDAVRFFGRVSEARKQELLTSCRCLAMPSRGEGFGLVYLEAMRLGRPCLVSSLDAGREVVAPPEAGLAADPSDAQALSAALAQLLAPGPAWQGWSAQAQRRYEQQFTARHFQTRLVDALAALEQP